MHACTKYCSEDVEPGEVCRKRFPRLLALYDHFALRPRLATDKDREWFSAVREFTSHLKSKIVSDLARDVGHDGEDDARVLLGLLARIAEAPVPIDGGGYFYKGVEIPGDAWFDYHLEKCRDFTEDESELIVLACYHYLTSVARHSRVVPRRSWESLRVPGYNPTLLAATMANGEVDLITHTPGVAEHYATKGSG